MSDREEALKDLKEQLDRIKDNNRQQIHLITLMADDYSQYAEDVAKLIIDHIKAAPSELKLIGIYVMDSIIKFSGETVERYRRLFGNEIVKLFVDAFEKVVMVGMYFFSIVQSLQRLIIDSTIPWILFIDS
uniref:CID domain-containing protein n=1 Tax=Panagrolaimus sp. ES5 TaxID=591445 RepID=A0AC34FLI3_9BILA